MRCSGRKHSPSDILVGNVIRTTIQKIFWSETFPIRYSGRKYIAPVRCSGRKHNSHQIFWSEIFSPWDILVGKYYGWSAYGAYPAKSTIRGRQAVKHWTQDVPNKACNPFNQRCRVMMILWVVSDVGGSRTELWRLSLPLDRLKLYTVGFR